MHRKRHPCFFIICTNQDLQDCQKRLIFAPTISNILFPMTPNQSSISAIIWDLDGTLLDTLQDLAEAVNYALAQFGMPQHSIGDIRQYVGNGVRRLMILSIPDGEDNPQFDQVFTTFKQYYIQHCNNHTRLYDGIAEVLSMLRAQGYRMAVVSNKLQRGVDELFELYFKEYMDVCIGERQGIPRKPAPDMVQLALEELHITSHEAIYIGDSDVDISTAHNAGLPCISVLWGFRDKEFLSAQGAQIFASQPREIPDIIQRLSDK